MHRKIVQQQRNACFLKKILNKLFIPSKEYFKTGSSHACNCSLKEVSSEHNFPGAIKITLILNKT